MEFITNRKKKRMARNKHGKRMASHGMRAEKVTPMKSGIFAPSKEPPARVDLRQYCSPVEDQSQSNSCCANAAVGAYEYLCWREAASNGDEPGDISRMFVYYIGRLRDKQLYQESTPIADEGMSLAGAIDALSTKGACLQEMWPFVLDEINTTPSPEAFEQAMRYKISEAKEIPVSLTAMKACLAEGYPIIFGLKLTKKFFAPGPKGIIETPDPDDPQSAEHGLHAMLIVGYSDLEQRFIVRNSWGADWADNGYCYVPYEYCANEEFNFLGQYAIYGLTETDFTPESTPDDAALFERGEEEDGGGHEDIEVEEDDVEEAGGDVDQGVIEEMFSPMEEARRAFNMFDADGSGELDLKELNKALLLNGTFMKLRKLKKLMRKFDADGSGSLSFEEFIKIPGVLPVHSGGMVDEDED